MIVDVARQLDPAPLSPVMAGVDSVARNLAGLLEMVTSRRLTAANLVTNNEKLGASDNPILISLICLLFWSLTYRANSWFLGKLSNFITLKMLM